MPKRKRTHVRQQDLAEWRKQNIPKKCPILGIADFLPVVDHDHKSGRIRGVISNQSNVLLGKAENSFRSRCSATDLSLPEVLRNLADYLEQSQGPYHPVGLRQLTKRFGRMKKGEQESILSLQGIPEGEIKRCKNSKERTKLYRKALING